jgi:hypothetical protein
MQDVAIARRAYEERCALAKRLGSAAPTAA